MNKEQAIGYMLLACKRLNLDKETVKKLRNAMCYELDIRTEEGAEKLGGTYFDEQIIEGTAILSFQKPKREEQQALEEEFQHLWMNYPRRLGKTNAFKAYVRARKRGVSFSEIAQGLESYLGYIYRNKLDTSYVKHGSTWFRTEGWEDDYTQ